MIPDKRFAWDAFWSVLNPPGRTGEKEGVAQECQLPSALAGTRFSVISLPCPSIAAPGPQKKAIELALCFPALTSSKCPRSIVRLLSSVLI